MYISVILGTVILNFKKFDCLFAIIEMAMSAQKRLSSNLNAGGCFIASSGTI